MKSQREGTKRGAVREPHAQKKEATVKRGKERDSEAQHKATAQGPRNGCLSCKGLHWVKDCPNLTETQRKEVLDRLQEKKNKASEDRDTHTLHVGHDAGDGSEMQVKQNGLLTVPLIPDSAPIGQTYQHLLWKNSRLYSPHYRLSKWRSR
ncbi:hypothetical protein JG687_00007116 [Phytophthora cactorum]|uniref:Uncharacterized protein n=1 Tax=Phytophthora cactorum TaxID=29920 RepID=A0A329RSD3_9STRA|nr:hypothetical protein PC112_g19283 [Phytophthora cactorum]KAG2805542.1 hypothetical protein PC111_g17763 [Phytophthora cactorum]KAG2818857.1 hypothetical protein PC113_g22809 [Phytophthora cactorum]KAG2882456.1 hypothetical protein PC114_g21029 [Phytophthora cactorum]KAG2887503.1 hypothetical protein PC115_g20315 [Phytophthora cactorum]